ncbi:type II toxin-antitoxin system RelE/ParE family toxin [Parabacteroides sp.]
MIVTFEKKYLKELYEKGETDDKKHRFQPDIVKRYKKCIYTLLHTEKVEELLPIKALNYEVLKGDMKGLSSIRVNNKYRIVFSIRETVDEPVITICNIIDLSNHYK